MVYCAVRAKYTRNTANNLPILNQTDKEEKKKIVLNSFRNNLFLGNILNFYSEYCKITDRRD